MKRPTVPTSVRRIRRVRTVFACQVLSFGECPARYPCWMICSRKQDGLAYMELTRSISRAMKQHQGALPNWFAVTFSLIDNPSPEKLVCGGQRGEVQQLKPYSGTFNTKMEPLLVPRHPIIEVSSREKREHEWNRAPNRQLLGHVHPCVFAQREG